MEEQVPQGLTRAVLREVVDTVLTVNNLKDLEDVESRYLLEFFVDLLLLLDVDHFLLDLDDPADSDVFVEGIVEHPEHLA